MYVLQSNINTMDYFDMTFKASYELEGGPVETDIVLYLGEFTHSDKEHYKRGKGSKKPVNLVLT